MGVATTESLQDVNVLSAEHKAILDEILAHNLGQPGATMVVLTLAQERIGFISHAMQEYLAQQLGISIGHLYGVLTFYSSFRMSPIGRHKVSICLGTACYVRGGPTVVEKLQQVLGVQTGETTADDRFTLEICRCVGACSQAPVVMIDEDVKGRVKPQDVAKLLRDYA